MTTRLNEVLRSSQVTNWLLGLAMFAAALPVSAGEPADWYQWRGPEANGISREKNLPSKWSPKGENLLWSKPEYGSRNTPITMNGKLYLVTRYKPETTGGR